MTVLYLDPNAAPEHLQRIEHILQQWGEVVDELSRIARFVQANWEAPAAQDWTARLQGLRLAYIRRLRMASELHQKAWKEYYEWLGMDSPFWSFYGDLRILHDSLEKLDTLDDWNERLSDAFDLSFLALRLDLSKSWMAGLSGVALVGGHQQFTSLGAVLGNAHMMASKRAWRVFKDKFNVKSAGFWLSVGSEFLEEITEPPEYYGDALRSTIDTGTEIAVGVVTSAAITGVGVYMGSAIGGTIGGMVGGPVGAVIGMKAGALVGPLASEWVAESIQIGGVEAQEWLEEQVSDWVTEQIADDVEQVLDAAGEAVEVASSAVQQATNWAEKGIRSVASFFGG